MAMKQVIAWSLSRDTEVGGGGLFYDYTLFNSSWKQQRIWFYHVKQVSISIRFTKTLFTKKIETQLSSVVKISPN